MNQAVQPATAKGAWRKWVLFAAGLSVCGALLALALFLRAVLGPGITPRNVEAIRPGMTAAEVEALLGGPPGLYDPTVSVEPVPAAAPPGKHWIGGRAAVYVCFDPDGRVTESHPLAVRPIGSTNPLDRLLRWLGL
jgi:hypothetical protein